jgi:hypothetical protein
MIYFKTKLEQEIIICLEWHIKSEREVLEEC